MPHLRCIGCGVTSYAPASGAGSCPECGVPWPARAEAGASPGAAGSRVEVLVRMTRDLLDVDLAMLTEIRDGRESVRAAAGEWSELGSLQDASHPFDDTFCRLMLEGQIGNVVGDARADERVAELDFWRRFGVGAWMGVAIRPSDAELYVLCCLARESRPNLGEREVRLLGGLAESVRSELEGQVAR